MKDVESRLAGHGRLLVRYSGTEPLLRIMLEGRDRDEIARHGRARLPRVVQGVNSRSTAPCTSTLHAGTR